MTYSNLIARSIATPNKSSRNGRKVDHIVLHHMASTNGAYVEELMRTGAKEVSANYIMRNSGELVGVVPEEMRSWSLSSAEWDGRSITVETENLSANGWTISAEAAEGLARLVADVCIRYGIPCTRDRVLGHREVYTLHGASYPTACPGGMGLDYIVARAQQIIAGNVPTPVPVETPWEKYEKELDMLSMIYANDVKANPQKRWCVTGPGYWRVITSDQEAANTTSVRYGSAANLTWADWDRAFDAAVSSGFVPAPGQTSRTV